MSRVTNYVLLLSTLNDNPLDTTATDAVAREVEEINQQLKLLEKFQRMDDSAGGYKGMECRVFGLAGNYLQFSTVRSAILDVEWRDEDGVMLVYHGPDDSGFESFTLKQLRAMPKEEWSIR
jgi:hypothetical protein